jgi:pilus assembly protein CpaB
LFAVLAAAASSTALYKIISANAQHTVKAATVQIIVAARDLNAGDLVGDGDVRETEWPVAGASQWARRREDVVGRGLLAAINKDEPFAETRLAAKGAGGGLASIIPPGMRVVAVHVDELTGLSRLIMPGMRVDVISTGVAGGGTAGSRTILQNIEIFSNGPNPDHEAKPAAVQAFNLLVTPQQAEVLSQAVAQTRITLMLRNPLDKGSFLSDVIPAQRVPSDATPPKVTRTVSRAPDKPLLPPAPPAPLTVEIIHGSKKTVTTVGPADQESK